MFFIQHLQGESCHLAPWDAIILHTNMAEPNELQLLCWGGDWDLPSVHTDCLVVLVTTRVMLTLVLNTFSQFNI